MALSGTLVTSSDDGLYIQFDWTATQDYVNNTSTISWTAKCAGTASTLIKTRNASEFSVSVNGQEIVVWKKSSNTVRSGSIIDSGSFVIPHDSDGSKSIKIIVGCLFLYRASLGGNQTFTLNVIPRPTTPSVSGSITIGDSKTITLTPNVSGLIHTLTYDFGSLTNQTEGIVKESPTSTTATFTPPLSLASQIPDAIGWICKINCKTYYGETLLGTRTISVTMGVDFNDVAPVITRSAITEGVSSIASRFFAYEVLASEPSDFTANYSDYFSRSGSGTTEDPYVYTALSSVVEFVENTYYKKIYYFIKNQSKLSVAITAYPVLGATIKSYQTTIQDKTYSGASFTSDIITASGTIEVKISVTDSRGVITTRTISVTVDNYSQPTISYMRSYRINTAGTAAEQGERVAVNFNYSIYALHNLNIKSYSIGYRLSNGSGFTTIKTVTDASSYAPSARLLELFTSSPEISVDNSYVIRLSVTDFFGTTTYDFTIPTGTTILDIRTNGKGIAIGKASEKDAFEVAMDTEIDGDLEISGSIVGQDEEHDLTFFWSWESVGDKNACCWKDKNGVVHLAGVIAGGTYMGAAYVIARVPEGYAPAATEWFNVFEIDNNYEITPYVFYIDTNGNIMAQHSRVDSPTGKFSLSGISFRASDT